jgi:radical SAM superfamily enzyme YgiQ (UPF0313 family)
MKALLVYARFPATYWGFQYGLPLTGTAASLPPLGLISVAALLPSRWQLRLVDLNVRPLDDEDLAWADVVLVGGMLIQQPSMLEVIERARGCGCLTAVGGPATRSAPAAFVAADWVFVGEAEGHIDELVARIEQAHGQRAERRVGAAPGQVLRPDDRERTPMTDVPVPRFDLLEVDRYASMSVQYSRGCPFNCEFCDVIELFGRVPRVKSTDQVLAELAALYDMGYRGTVFVVDDNFIGNKRSVKQLLACLESWQRERGEPFELYTEASVNLAEDRELLEAMVRAGFSSVFLGIETPSERSLQEAGKRQNVATDLEQAIRVITAAGMEVMGGFIVGFDHDDPSVFELQRQFISSLPIPLAMVGVLTAMPGTGLWRRLEREGRLCDGAAVSGDQFGRPNFVTKMDEEALLRGYARLLEQLYEPASYVARCRDHIDRTRAARRSRGIHSLREIGTLFRALWHLGAVGPRRGAFWSLLGYSMWRAPHTFSWAVAHAIMGEHMVRYTQDDVLPRLARAIEEVRAQRRRVALRSGQPEPRPQLVASAPVRFAAGEPALATSCG